MNHDSLLATYSLLAYIRESSKEEENKSILRVFLPILKETLNRMFCKVGTVLQGRDYTELMAMVEQEFGLKIPIPVIDRLMHEIYRTSKGGFVLNNDHSFIIRTEINTDIASNYKTQKRRIQQLKRNFALFCEGLGVEANFTDLVTFIQDQKNRIFEQQPSSIYTQGFHISKYVYTKIKKRDAYYDIICDIYLGGVIASYLQFQIKEQIVNSELLIDTNFYISLINLNTEESYEACKQLFDLTIGMGYRYSILESTIEQIKILLSNRARQVKSKGLLASLDVADVLAACERRGLGKNDLENIKDNLRDDLSSKGISIIYNSSIRHLIEKTEKSSDLCKLTKLRGNKDSAFNDLLAQEYVSYKRKGKAITEFNDVNCWFLNNSFSVNWKEKDKPVWKRISITASDLLVLLWLANPSLPMGNNRHMLAIASLSANVINYRSGRYPSGKVVSRLQDKIAKLQEQHNISEKSVANLCLRMAEGAIDQTEAERLLVLSTEDLKEHIESYSKLDESFIEKSEELDLQKSVNSELQEKLHKKELQAKLFKMRTWGIVYFVIIFVVYYLGNLFIPDIPIKWLSVSGQLLYWILTTIIVNWFNHLYFVYGILSFINKEKIEKMIESSNI